MPVLNPTPDLQATPGTAHSEEGTSQVAVKHDSSALAARLNTLNRTYSFEAVEAILQRAMSYQIETQFSPEQLQEMADELSIPPETLLAAEQAWQNEQSDLQAAATDTTSASKSQESPKSNTLAQYGVISAFLLALNIALAGSITWAVYPVLGMGLSAGLKCCGNSAASRYAS
ncbi:MAG: hypothetical protein AAGF24_14530 [Cyanobacteria bacterium P01_H01_bin.121]